MQFNESVVQHMSMQTVKNVSTNTYLVQSRVQQHYLFLPMLLFLFSQCFKNVDNLFFISCFLLLITFFIDHHLSEIFKVQHICLSQIVLAFHIDLNGIKQWKIIEVQGLQGVVIRSFFLLALFLFKLTKCCFCRQVQSMGETMHSLGTTPKSMFV